jgi:hypothetical protein
MTNLVVTPALDVALAHIDMTRWGSKANVIALIRAKTDGDGIARLGAREVADVFGWKQKRGATQLLDELVKARVLILSQRAAGNVGTGYRINPEVGQWDVPWRKQVIPELVIHRVAGALFARPGSRRSPRVAARRVVGPQAEFGARRVVGPQSEACGPTVSGPKPAASGPTNYRAANPAGDPPHMPYCPPYGFREREELQKIVQAIDRKGGFVRGRPLEQLAELLAEGLDAEAAVVVIDRRSWGKDGVGLRIVDYLRTMGVDLPAEARRLLAAEQEQAAAQAKLEREREEAEAALRELREEPGVRADRLALLRSAMERSPVSQNGHNGNGNGKEPTGA